MHHTDEEIRGWFAGRVPTDWFTGPPELKGDREEIIVTGELADVTLAKDASDAEHRFGRKVAWGVAVGGETHMFTTLSVPVMTRLRLRERGVLDTLVDAGVARSRSEALAWCVKLVGDHEGEWIEALRTAIAGVESVRAEGPRPD